MACRDLPLPCDSRGGLGWGCLCFSVQPNVAMASGNKTPCGNVGLLPLAALAPHPNPPLLRRGGSTSLHASRYTLKLVSLELGQLVAATIRLRPITGSANLRASADGAGRTIYEATFHSLSPFIQVRINRRSLEVPCATRRLTARS